MHHPYLVCILFGMSSLHLFTFSMFFIFLYNDGWETKNHVNERDLIVTFDLLIAWCLHGQD